MAVSVNTVWELRSTATANMVNGGGWVVGGSGVDYSQQNAAQYALTGLTSAGAGNTILTASAAADMVGNIAKCTAGTNAVVGWYEIVSVSVGVSITFGTNRSGASIASGVASGVALNIGGALNFGAVEDDFFEAVNGGNTVWIKAGTYTASGIISVASTLSTTTAPSNFIGYNSTRGDYPTFGSQPIFDLATNNITLGVQQNLWNVTVINPGSNGIYAAGAQRCVRCKIINPGSTAGQIGFQPFDGGVVQDCEAVIPNGYGIFLASQNLVTGNYVHDCNIGIYSGNGCRIDGNVIASCKTTAIQAQHSGTTSRSAVCNNTIYGSGAKIGTGILLAAGTYHVDIYNNNISGFVTGINQTTSELKSNVVYTNNFYNNTNDVTNSTKGLGCVAVNPEFTVTELTGSGATSATTVITHGAADFTSVVDNRDYVHVISATTATPGQYLIIGHTTTTLTLNRTIGTGTNIVYAICVGHSFAPGANLKNIATPLTFGGLTTNYKDLGAVQAQATGGSSEHAYTFVN